MKRLLVAIALLAMPLAAQQAPAKKAPTPAQAEKIPLPAPPKQPMVQKLFILKYADPNQVSRLISVFSGSTYVSSEMHAMTVSASTESMPAIEDAIKKLDVPFAAPQDVDLMAYLVIGAQKDDPATEPLPKELDSVVAQLKGAFSYKSYRLMDMLTLRTRTGRQVETTSNGGSVKVGDIYNPIVTQFRIQSVTVGADGSIRIDGLRVGNRVPIATGSIAPTGGGTSPLVSTQIQYLDLGINADVDIKDGQKLVVGKMGMNNNEAMFVVLTAHVAQ